MKPTQKKPTPPKTKIARVRNVMKAEERAIGKTERNFHNLEIRTMQGKAPYRGKPRRLGKRSAKEKAEDDKFIDDLDPFKNATVIPPASFLRLPQEKGAGLQAMSSTTVATGQTASASIHTGNHYVDAMLTGFATSADRMPDPYTCVKTFTTNCHYSDIVAPNYPISGTTTYGGRSFLLMGSGAETIGSPVLTPDASDVKVAYNGIVPLNVGMGSTALLSRPVGVTQTLTFLGVGPVHKVTVTAIPILPDVISTLAAAPVSWPTTLSAGLTTIMSIWGGRQWQLEPGESLDFICSPLDNRSFDFEQSSIARGRFDALGQIAWSGWLVWFWGMTAGDTIARRVVVGEECCYVTNGSTSYAFPQSRNPPDPIRSSTAKNLFSSLMEKGYGAFKYAFDRQFPMLSNIWKSLSPQSLGMNSDTQPTGFMSAAATSLMRRPLQQLTVNPQEEKELEDCPLHMQLSEATKTVNALTDAPEVVTPRYARRPSLALSLTKKR